jgi:hypothetical protein
VPLKPQAMSELVRSSSGNFSNGRLEVFFMKDVYTYCPLARISVHANANSIALVHSVNEEVAEARVGGDLLKSGHSQQGGIEVNQLHNERTDIWSG